jgi:hypothetical protein
MADATLETWDLWYPEAGSRGLSFCRAAIAPAAVVLVHAAPSVLSVELRDGQGRRLAFAAELSRSGERFPMTRLVREGWTLRREDGWPGADDIGRTVLLPGGEAGVLRQWWNAADGSEWRWQVEFYNHR